MIFNTTEGSQSISDSFSLRQAALLSNVPYYTTISGCNAVILAIKKLKSMKIKYKIIAILLIFSYKSVFKKFKLEN